MKITRLFPLLAIASLLILPSCFDDDDDNSSNDYTDWRARNEEYFEQMETATEDGVSTYEKITPVWDDSFSILLKWHNNREETVNRITPLSNSTCLIKYTLTNIDGDTIDSSNSFSCQPNGLVTGFTVALTNMNIGDTVTAILPYSAGYGVYGYGNVPPYSTLIFGIRLVDITKLM